MTSVVILIVDVLVALFLVGVVNVFLLILQSLFFSFRSSPLV